MATPNHAVNGPLLFHLTRVSSNSKTGPIPVSTSGKVTCAPSCPFLGQCYASSGPLAIHWAAVSDGRLGIPWQQFLTAVASLPVGQLWRHNQAGDLYRPHTLIGQTALAALVAANRGRRGFTYSHHPLAPKVAAAFKAATAQGFTVNASTESMAAADAAVRQGLRAVVVVASTETRHRWASPDGNPVILCPAQRKGPQFAAMNCATCRLCQARPQNVIIAFAAHGTNKRRIDQLITAGGPDA